MNLKTEANRREINRKNENKDRKSNPYNWSELSIKNFEREFENRG